MEFGLFTCGYQRKNIEQAFADAASFGYDYIELWGGRPHGYAQDLIEYSAKTIRGFSERYSIPVRIYTPEHNAYPFNYMMGDQMQWEDSIQYLRSAIHASALLGAEAVLISIGHSGGLSPECRHNRLIQSLQLLSVEAHKMGQTILLENLTPMESDGYTSLEDYSELFDDNNFCKAMCDVVVPFVQDQDPVEYYHVLGEKLRHIHLADSNGTDESHVMPGDGIMNPGAVLRDFCKAGYNGSVTIELVTAYLENPSEAAELAIKRIKELL